MTIRSISGAPIYSGWRLLGNRMKSRTQRANASTTSGGATADLQGRPETVEELWLLGWSWGKGSQEGFHLAPLPPPPASGGERFIRSAGGCKKKNLTPELGPWIRGEKTLTPELCVRRGEFYDRRDTYCDRRSVHCDRADRIITCKGRSHAQPTTWGSGC